ncbi:unnamed protein product [Didymodactylos carnosus]|uniref:Pyruvate dehydrogenase phosphatase regulatory subunit, mitochondrial n=1 Tax=Didymodactylos carnosus TaxID=1234261 RepID=A0A814GMF0_9BILA|nr:unnamed protein product [Didymodactylos carnosus]CAF0998322.1 unnamed protein product [Didymodactylos carnosus]CAF3678582.1 unnamed protein product [Didymodactylos carnosus]CAF3769820.1 unnamed protein product [Didymodactylos carnosus]
MSSSLMKVVQKPINSIIVPRRNYYGGIYVTGPPCIGLASREKLISLALFCSVPFLYPMYIWIHLQHYNGSGRTWSAYQKQNAEKHKRDQKIAKSRQEKSNKTLLRYLLNTIRYTEHSHCLWFKRGLTTYEHHESPTIPHIHSYQQQLPFTETIPSKCHVVIAGGGLVGISVAYHLNEIGIKDVVLLERVKLASAATWQSGGQVSLIQGTVIETIFAKYSRQLYEQLHKSEHDIGFTEKGSIWIAQTSDRLHTLKRQLAEAKALDIRCETLNTEKLMEKVPILDPHEIWGALWIPQDCMVDPVSLSVTLAQLAMKGGVKIIENCSVKEINTEKQRAGEYHHVTGVLTSQGEIKCNVFINCTGMWARELGFFSNPTVRIPTQACEYICLKTKPVPNFPLNIPIVRSPDEHFYVQPLADQSVLIGGFLPESRPIFSNGVPDTFNFSLLQENWDDFQAILGNTIKRLSILADSDCETLITGADSFSPDGKLIMNESAEIDNYFVATGTNANGIALAGGIGKFIAESVFLGDTKTSTWPVDIRRFMRLHTNKRFLNDRLREIPGKQFSLKYPTYGMSLYRTGRKLRVSALHPKLQALGAVFGELLGYERPLFFNIDEAGKDEYIEDRNKQGTFGKPTWFNSVKKEYNACRRRVAVIDMTSFTKFEIKSAGRSVVDFLQHLCANNIDKPIGTVIHTGMLNQHGGYENDCSVVRLGEYHFLIISPTSQSTRSMKWLKSHFPDDGSIFLSDVTSLYTALNVIGPKAKHLLGEISDEPFNDFARMTCREIDVGFASHIYAMRLTHTAEDGFMLYIPSDYALCVYDLLMEQGKDYGIINAGYFAMRTLRIESMFAFWGQDLDKMITPLDCNREFRVHFDKNFIGKEALLLQRKQGIKKRFIQFLLEDHDLDLDPWPWSGEPIYRNGRFCGFVTSTAYGFTLGKQVCLGYVHAEGKDICTTDYIRNATYEIDIAGKRFKAKSNLYQPSEMGPTIQLSTP